MIELQIDTGDGNIKITIDEIKKLKMINRDVVSIGSDGAKSKLNVSGCLLEELLKKQGISQSELPGVRVTAVDGYSMEIPSEILKNREIILAYEINGKPLFEGDRFVRVVISGEKAMYWTKSISTIEIAEQGMTGSEQVERILIFDSAVSCLNKWDYRYGGNLDRAIKSGDLLRKFVSEDEGQILIKAADGLQRNETRETFKDAFIKITGKESPMFISPDLSKGMYVKNMLWFISKTTAFLIVDKALEVYNNPVLGNTKGIPLKEVLKDINLREANIYIFRSSDKYSVRVSKDNIHKSMLYKVNHGGIGVGFNEPNKNIVIKNLLSIEAVHE